MSGVRAFALTLALGIAAAAAVPAAAEQGANARERYFVTPTDKGVLRVDRQTGRVSLCADRDDTATCSLVADDREAYEAEIARLQAEVDRLRARVAELEGGAVTGDVETFGDLPSREEVDKALDLTEHVFRRFFDMARRLEREQQEELNP